MADGPAILLSINAAEYSAAMVSFGYTDEAAVDEAFVAAQQHSFATVQSTNLAALATSFAAAEESSVAETVETALALAADRPDRPTVSCTADRTIQSAFLQSHGTTLPETVLAARRQALGNTY
jgi:phosphoribosylaminoimidazole carboxylase (NCAIR synthetase)